MIGHDNFSCTVVDFKTVSGTGHTITESQMTEQKLKFLYHTEPRDNFLSYIKLSKIPK
jgi:hypothetical protein